MIAFDCHMIRIWVWAKTYSEQTTLARWRLFCWICCQCTKNILAIKRESIFFAFAFFLRGERYNHAFLISLSFATVSIIGITYGFIGVPSVANSLWPPACYTAPCIDDYHLRTREALSPLLTRGQSVTILSFWMQCRLKFMTDNFGWANALEKCRNPPELLWLCLPWDLDGYWLLGRSPSVNLLTIFQVSCTNTICAKWFRLASFTIIGLVDVIKQVKKLKKHQMHWSDQWESFHQDTAALPQWISEWVFPPFGQSSHLIWRALAPG